MSQRRQRHSGSGSLAASRSGARPPAPPLNRGADDHRERLPWAPERGPPAPRGKGGEHQEKPMAQNLLPPQGSSGQQQTAPRPWARSPLRPVPAQTHRPCAFHRTKLDSQPERRGLCAPHHPGRPALPCCHGIWIPAPCTLRPAQAASLAAVAEWRC